MSYTLNHTAESIDRKLSLVNENKNLLEYPYATTFAAGLEDVGDGSILTTGTSYAEVKVFLNDLTLPAGTYMTSLNVADVLDMTESVANPGFNLELVSDETTIDTSKSFTLSKETKVSAYLVVSTNGFDMDLVIRPQIEAGNAITKWVPYMKDIGSYVDERFNSTNIKIKTLARDVRNILTGTTAPSDDIGEEGDIYLVIEE